MKQFFISLFATIIGSAISFFIILFIGIMMLVGIASTATKDDSVTIKDKSVLMLKLNYPIKDRSSNDPFENMDFSTLKSKQTPGLNDIIRSIKSAKEDSKVKGIYLNPSVIMSGVATIEEIRNALLDFKESGKFIISYSDNYTQGAYYLASVSDKIYLTPMGSVEFRGLGGTSFFYKNALEKLGVEAQVIKHGKFKSAVEPFILEKMSSENRHQVKTLIGSIWNHMLEGISKQRNIPVDKLNKLTDELAVMKSTKSALDNKLVDGIIYKDELIEILKDLTDTKKVSVNTVSRYVKSIKPQKYCKDKIAVIYAEGEIVGGEGKKEQIGGDHISKIIRKARKDSTIKAVVLRVNSPGGSALASEVMWREVEITKKEKPVIVSMGNLAASGGYYMSCAADVIVAQPNTITGSIGVFGVIPNAKKLLNNKLGITTDHVGTNDNSDYMSITRPMRTSEKNLIKGFIEEIYVTFVNRVSNGRNMSFEAVDKVGEGRVWSGITAKEIGLVDELGGLNKAIEIAQEKAGLEAYKLKEMPFQKDPMTELLESFKTSVKTSFMKEELGVGYKHYKRINSILKTDEFQTRMPFDLEIN